MSYDLQSMIWLYQSFSWINTCKEHLTLPTETAIAVPRRGEVLVVLRRKFNLEGKVFDLSVTERRGKI